MLSEEEDVLSEKALREGPWKFLGVGGGGLWFSCVGRGGAVGLRLVVGVAPCILGACEEGEGVVLVVV